MDKAARVHGTGEYDYLETTAPADESKDAVQKESVFNTGPGPVVVEKDFSTSRTVSVDSQISKPKSTDFGDVEKGLSADVSNEPFDFAKSLRKWKAMQDDAGIREKRLPVLFEDLSVFGRGGSNKTKVKTFPDSIVDFFNIYATAMSLLNKRQGEESEILQGFRGVVKPGEMVLVLGRPGSGCTTFLKTIANLRAGFTKVTGNVQYGKLDSKAFQQYRGQALYNMEDDIHLPSLNVRQTLEFAAETTAPGKRPPGMSVEDYKKHLVDLYMSCLNITHTSSTLVGNAHIRGISGGERKRVSLAEMMIAGAPVSAWDNSTRGLDSSSALSLAQSLKTIANVFGVTTFVSLYQCSENIYRQFDKVLLIDGGRQVYFGPTTEARAYFENLNFAPKPRQTTADYLTGCTDPFEREYAANLSGPAGPEQLAKAFDGSELARKLDCQIADHKRMLEVETDTEQFQLAVGESKRHASKSSVYTIPFRLQVWAIARRQFFLKWQYKFMLGVSWFTSMTIAIVLGTLWYQLPETSAGAFSRGGLIFISILFNTFEAFSELPSTMMGRNLQNKHRQFAFFQPSAQWIAQICVDMCYSFTKITAFSVIVYFMCGLVYAPGAFFIYILTIMLCFLSMTLLFRSLACASPSYDFALRVAGLLMICLVMNAGYMVSYPDTPKWFRWLFWVNPIGLGWSSLMISQFRLFNMECTSESLIPPYGMLESRVCTLPGSRTGQTFVTGPDYLEASFGYRVENQWRNFGLILVTIVAFFCTNVTFSELFIYNAGGKTVTPFIPENKERKRLNDELLARRQKRLEKQSQETMADSEIASESVLTWEGVGYSVPVKKQQVTLLRDVTGYCAPGKLTALMGASGAGKTTLLDVLAQRKNIGIITGDILVDGAPRDVEFRRVTGYAEQLDLFEGTQTVREALRFSADLRRPSSIPQSEKYAYVEEIISLLELEDLADAIIGTPDTGLAVEQRKRVCIGAELSAKPKLLLFLDEPTTGLDSQSAFNVIRYLKKLASAGQSILCTIHQPNSALFAHFDRLLLLQKGGQTVYFGDIGHDSEVLLNYFAARGAPCPPTSNIAEFMLETIGAGQKPRVGDRDWHSLWQESTELKMVKHEIQNFKSGRILAKGAAMPQAQSEYASSFAQQIKQVSRRAHVALWRSPSYGFTRLFNHVALSLVVGLAFIQLGNSRADVQHRVFTLFMVTVLPSLLLAQVEPRYDVSRLLFYRDSSAKAYGHFPFAISMVLAELPYGVICAVCFYLLIYFVPGFSMEPSRAGLQFFFTFLAENFAVTLGQALAALTPSSFIAALFNPFVVIMFSFFCGVTIRPDQIPSGWHWMLDLNPVAHLIGGMIVTELHDLPVRCKMSELNNFTAPATESCGAFMAPFFAAGAPGYLLNNDTSNCAYCAFKVGDDFYTPLNYSWEHRWRDLGIFSAFIGSNLIILGLAARFLNFSRR